MVRRSGVQGFAICRFSRNSKCNFAVSDRGRTEMMWSQREEIKLRELWEQGIRLRTIAAMMGKTSGAIAGKVDRLDLAPRDKREFARRGEECSWWKGGRSRARYRAVRRVSLPQQADAHDSNPQRKITKPGRLARFVLGY